MVVEIAAAIELKIQMRSNGEVTATWPTDVAKAILMLEITKQMILNPQSRQMITPPNGGGTPKEVV